MVYRSLRIDGDVDASLADGLDATVRSRGGRISWRSSMRTRRRYGLCAWPPNEGSPDIPVTAGVTTYATAIIALAVFPAVPEALPHLIEALGGPGRPAGMISCESCAEGAVLEWDLDRTAASLVLALVDVELARFGSARTSELLSPLPPVWLARIAADGLNAPEITPDRILETLVERAGLRV